VHPQVCHANNPHLNLHFNHIFPKPTQPPKPSKPSKPYKLPVSMYRYFEPTLCTEPMGVYIPHRYVSVQRASRSSVQIGTDRYIGTWFRYIFGVPIVPKSVQIGTHRYILLVTNVTDRYNRYSLRCNIITITWFY
jgi:hypothetical protein